MEVRKLLTVQILNFTLSMESNESVKIFHRRKKQILETWMKNQLASDALREDLMSNEELYRQSEEVLNGLLSSLTEKNLGSAESLDFDRVKEVLSAISIARARRGFSSREIGNYVFSLKRALLEVLASEMKDREEWSRQSQEIGNIIDNLGIHSFEVFIKGREEVIARQVDEISEISNPVMRVWTGVLAIPIIGTLDSARTQVVMESLLQQIVETESSIAIIDISGVPAVDSLVAQHLIKTVSATRLMGAECIISGIRPEIAQTIVHLGIDLSQIITKSSLASAIKTSFDMLQIEVVKKQKKLL